MQVKMLRQSMTLDYGSTATNVKVDCHYVYLTNIPISIGVKFIVPIIRHIEQLNNADRVYDLQLVRDDTTGFWTVKFTSKKEYPADYTINTPDPQIVAQ